MKALDYECPRWELDPDTREEHYVWPGHIRFVSAHRARKLRKRGVPLMPCHKVLDRGGGTHSPGFVEPTTPGRGPGTRNARYAWFETDESYETRARRRHERAQARFMKRNWERTDVYVGVIHHNTFAGMDVADGPDHTASYWLEFGTQTAADRAARKSPPVTLWYQSGGVLS